MKKQVVWTPSNSKIGFKFKTTDLSNFDKRCSDAHFGSFLFHYYCKTIINKSRGRGAEYAPHITTCPPGFSDLPAILFRVYKGRLAWMDAIPETFELRNKTFLLKFSKSQKQFFLKLNCPKSDQNILKDFCLSLSQRPRTDLNKSSLPILRLPQHESL